MCFKETTEVTDPAEITRLDRNESRDGESLDRPWSPDDEPDEALKATVLERSAEAKASPDGSPKFGDG